MKHTFGYVVLSVFLLLFTNCKNTSKKSQVGLAEQPLQQDELKLLVGTFAEGDDQGIYQLHFNPETGVLSNSRRVVEENKPGYLYLSKDGERVYSSNGTKPGSVSAFKWNKDRTALDKMGNLSSKGDGACYIGLSPEEDLLAAANYGSGGIVLYPVDENGEIVDAPQEIQHEGSGPHPNQKSAHAHCVQFSSNGNFLYAVDLGIDQILAYPIAPERKLGKAEIGLQLDPGDGPRHLIFHPTKNMAFIINELSSTVVAASVDPLTGKFQKIDKQSTLPAGYEGKNSCADIHLSPNGKFLYASNRGHNSIAVYSVLDSGHLKPVTIESVQGDWPRNFTLSPDGKFLLVANQKSNNITVFKVDMETGRLKYTGHQINVPQPVCLKF